MIFCRLRLRLPSWRRKGVAPLLSRMNLMMIWRYVPHPLLSGVAELSECLTLQKEDGVVKKTIDDLLRDHLVVLSSSKTSEDGEWVCGWTSESGREQQGHGKLSLCMYDFWPYQWSAWRHLYMSRSLLVVEQCVFRVVFSLTARSSTRTWCTRINPLHGKTVRKCWSRRKQLSCRDGSWLNFVSPSYICVDDTRPGGHGGWYENVGVRWDQTIPWILPGVCRYTPSHTSHSPHLTQYHTATDKHMHVYMYIAWLILALL